MSIEQTETLLKRNRNSLFARLDHGQRQILLTVLQTGTLTDALVKVSGSVESGGFGIHSSYAALSRFRCDMALLDQAARVESGLSLNPGEGAPIEDTNHLANCAENLLLRRIIQHHVEQRDPAQLRALYSALKIGSEFQPRAYGRNPTRRVGSKKLESAPQPPAEPTPGQLPSPAENELSQQDSSAEGEPSQLPSGQA